MNSLFLFVRGRIQGVGFRPFVSNLANDLDLKGYVKNIGSGVEILLQGERAKEFVELLPQKLPEIANIEEIQISECQKEAFAEFLILESQTQTQILIPPIPDLGICQDCQREIMSVENRRYFYPLINCTNCGPRHSVIVSFPYDRERTSMQKFQMCEECLEEYRNPKSRFYHAQPISCHKCSPKIFLNSQEIQNTQEVFSHLANLILQGEIICIQGIGGFHLVCDATNPKAIQSLRELKNRPSKPLALICKNLQEAKKIARISALEEKLLCSKEAPIVLLESKQNLKGIAPHSSYLGIMLAYTPIYALLFEYLDIPLVATSANFKGEPILFHADSKLFSLCPYVLHHQREIQTPIEDSIIQVVDTQVVSLRQARGYAPWSFRLKKKVQAPFLALGANQKASFAFVFEDLVILSPYIGDLDNLESIERFKTAITKFAKLYGITFEKVICDLHPQYQSTKLAYAFNPQPTQIQHHYAHTLSVCFEYGLKHEVLSFCFDGTGYGEDQCIWGGEVLSADVCGYQRILHFAYFRLLGGEIATKDIARNFFALLINQVESKELLEFFSHRGKSLQELQNLQIIAQKGLNSPLTSSVGRIFDAVAWACGLEKQSYEGESGGYLESLYLHEVQESYGFEIKQGEIFLDVVAIFKDCQNQMSPQKIASKFLNALCEIVCHIALQDLREVVLCGGVFCNKILSTKILKTLRENNKKCYLGSQIPPNDNGLALGQLYYLMQKEERNAR